MTKQNKYRNIKNTLFKGTWRFLLMFILAISCTKEVNLFTEVEFELTKQHSSEGFVNESLTTTITVVPEALLDGLEYRLSYSVDVGNGRFENSEGISFEQQKTIPFEDLSVSLNYVGAEIGEHTITITVEDSFGFSEQIEVSYVLENVPATWTLTSAVTQIELEEITPLTLTLSTNNLATGPSYEALYSITEGTGILTSIPGNEEVVVDEYGVIVPGTYELALSPSTLGTLGIEAILRDSNGQELTTNLSLEVVETIEVISVDLGKEDEIEMQVGDTLECPVVFEPSNATDQQITWTSSEPSVLLVDSNGNLTALTEGNAVVMATSISNPSASDTVLVTVTAVPTVAVESISLAQEDPMAMGITRQLIATVLPTNATNTDLIWSSGDTDVANVDANGLVTAVTGGTVTITATSVSDPSVSASIDLVLPAPALNGNDILTFALPEQNSAVINIDDHTIAVNVSDGTDLNVAPSTFTVSPGATVTPSITQVQDFSNVISYVVTADNGDEQVWSVSVTVAANLPPVAVNDVSVVQQGESVDIDVLGNDTDPDTPAAELTITALSTVSPVTAGAATINGNQIQFVANASFEGEATFTYTVNDGNPGNNATGTVTITISAVANSVPVAQDDNFTVPENGTLSENILNDNGNGADTDADNHPLLVDRVNANASNIGTPTAGSNGGRFTINANGTLEFDPNGEFDSLVDGETQQTAITYRINDSNGGVASATVTVTITGVNAANLPPIANAGPDISITLPTSSTELDASTSSDTDGTITGYLWEQVSGPNTASINDATAQITTVSNLILGNYVFMLTVTDDDDTPSTDIIEVTVNSALNTLPVAQDDLFTVPENGSISGSVFADNGNGIDTDADGDVLTVDRVDGSAINVGVVIPGDNGGSFTIEANGTFDFETNGEFDGLTEGETLQTTLDYRITDGNGGTATANVTVTVNGLSPANQAPTAEAGTNTTITLPESSATLDGSGSSDSDGVITLYLWEQVSGPNTAIIADQGVAITSVSGLVQGNYIFMLTVTDDAADEGTDTVEINVNAATNTAPVAENDFFTVAENNVLVRGVFNDNGNGPDSDAEDDPLTVDRVNNSPANIGIAVNGSLGGIFTIDAGGNLTFDPNGNFDSLNDGETEETTITYRITDGNGGTDEATVTVSVTGVSPSNGPPVAQNDAFTVAENATANGNVLVNNGNGNDNDPEGTAITVNQVNGSATNVGTTISGTNGGRFTVDANGSINFDPNGEFNTLNDGESQTTTVNYTITDGANTSNAATVTVTVTGVSPTNNPPVAQNDTFTVAENGTTNGNVFVNNGNGNDSDPEGNAITVNQVNGSTAGLGTAIAGTNGGQFTLATNGSLNFNPNGEFDALNDGESQTTSINYTITDGANTSNTATVTVTVTGVSPANSPPVAQDDAFVVAENGIINGNVLTDNGNGSDADLEGNSLSVNQVNGSPGNIGATIAGTNGGRFTIGANGAISFDPNGEFNALNDGESQTTNINYTITDGTNTSNTATVTVTVTGVSPANNPPMAVNDSYTINANTTLLGQVLDNDSDPDGNALTVIDVTQPVSGTVDIQPGGTGVTYAPPTGFAGNVSFTYTIDDGNGGTDTATVSVTVNAVNSVQFSDARAYNSGLGGTSFTVTGTITITGDDAVFTVNSFLLIAIDPSVPATLDHIITTSFTIDGDNYIVFATEGAPSANEVTPPYPAGTYSYTFSVEAEISNSSSTADWGGAVSASQD